tara:strand:- start:142 stop:621 length:480 start_codon:yes stop_codon:yes gene_type:complete
MVKIDIYTDKIDLSNGDNILSIVMDYEGEFVAQFKHNCKVDIINNKIIIKYNEPPRGLVMAYSGLLYIKSITAYDDNFEKIIVKRTLINDIWANKLSDYANNTNKWGSLNKELKQNFINNTLISYDFNGVTYYKNNKNKNIKENESSEIKKIKKIRGSL